MIHPEQVHRLAEVLPQPSRLHVLVNTWLKGIIHLAPPGQETAAGVHVEAVWSQGEHRRGQGEHGRGQGEQQIESSKGLEVLDSHTESPTKCHSGHEVVFSLS